jgi:membrane-associated phospholipid phosphatase
MVELLTNTDYGTYYFFRHEAQQLPGLDVAMQLGDLLATAVAASLVLMLATILFVMRGELRAALVGVLIFMAGVILVEIFQNLLAVQRPAYAGELVSAAEMARSFPARGVFIFTLASTLLLFAAWCSLHHTGLRLLVTANLTVLVLWAAMSQLALGLHFVTDVIGGLVGGLALALLATRFFPAAEAVPVTTTSRP